MEILYNVKVVRIVSRDFVVAQSSLYAKEPHSKIMSN